MDIGLIGRMAAELRAALAGRRFGRVYQVSPHEYLVDFRLPDSRFLFVSIEPRAPRIFLAARRLRDIERNAFNPGPFVLQLKKQLSNAEVADVRAVNGERILRIDAVRNDELEGAVRRSLIVQLTGRSSNLMICDEAGVVLERAKDTDGTGQQVGDVFTPPARPSGSEGAEQREDAGPPPGELSAVLDEEYRNRISEQRSDEIAKAARQRLQREIGRREKLLRNLEKDLLEHGDPERWKRFGDLLLANTATAERRGDELEVTDYFDDEAPKVRIPADANDSITEAAEKYFRRYTKARNAREEIERRRETVGAELEKLYRERELMEDAIARGDTESLAGERKAETERSRKKASKPTETERHARRFLSSDGYEILVGKRSTDNDFLTFRIARSLDTWMHAADYPGSHVVVRNRDRKDIPQRTLLEAAQLAAFYSQGKKQPKAAVHYTQKKFVNKPKGAAPGLVRLSQFKTILVEPVFPDLKDSGDAAPTS